LIRIRASDIAVARMLGPNPPNHAEIATAGMKNMKLGVGQSCLKATVTPCASRVVPTAST
jgi:hypothetical protein